MNIVFRGTPDFALESLKALNEHNYNIIVLQLIQINQKEGRKLTYSPVKEYAIKNNIKVYQPEKIKNNVEFKNLLEEINPDLICVVAYGKIIPKDILEIPKFGCVNVHGSLLPKYRGAAPIQWAVINGDKKTRCNNNVYE